MATATERSPQLSSTLPALRSLWMSGRGRRECSRCRPSQIWQSHRTRSAQLMSGCWALSLSTLRREAPASSST